MIYEPFLLYTFHIHIKTIYTYNNNYNVRGAFPFETVITFPHPGIIIINAVGYLVNKEIYNQFLSKPNTDSLVTNMN